MNNVVGMPTAEELTLWERILSTITSPINKLLAPYHIKKVGEAGAHVMNQLGQAAMLNPNISAKYTDENFDIHTIENTPVSDHTDFWLKNESTIRKQNLEAVLSMTQQYTGKIIALSSEPISDEWIMRFLTNAECVFDKELQSIWACVLAGEVQHPGSISLRTLDVLKNLSKKEADLFRKVLPLVFIRETDCFIWASGSILQNYKIYYRDIQLLDECGLLQSINTGIRFARADESCFANSFHNSKHLIRFEMHPDVKRLNYQRYTLTTAGKQLYHLLRGEPNDAFLTSVITSITDDPKACGVKMCKYAYHGNGETFIHDTTLVAEYNCAKKPTASDPLNINTADVKQLRSLSGIGENFAERIVQYRNENGSFKSLEDLKKVKGIGELRFNEIKKIAIL